MSSYNKIILLGNLTRDPQMSYLPSGTPVVDFGLATNRRWTGQDGQQRDETCFVDCRMFGKRAEVIQRYFKKGAPIFVDGRLTFDSWTAQDGTKRSRHRVSVENFEFVGQGGSGGQGGGQQNYAPQASQGGNQGGYGQPNQYNAPPQPPVADPGNSMPMGDDSFDPDDIPF
ncbi:MAG: single-stranded DNA-binding protein [Sedimentisphaeraceae bacterium JB056]